MILQRSNGAETTPGHALPRYTLPERSHSDGTKQTDKTKRTDKTTSRGSPEQKPPKHKLVKRKVFREKQTQKKRNVSAFNVIEVTQTFVFTEITQTKIMFTETTRT